MAVFEREKSSKITLDDTVPLSCTIETAQNVRDHTDYIIKVHRGPTADHHWYITRRYSDFVMLDAMLRVSAIDLPLPPKKVFGKMEREFIAERQQGLQTYLNTVLVNPLLANSLAAKKFLDPNNYSSNLQELALQNISMFFRSEPRWEVVEPSPDTGWRLRKQYFLVRDKNLPKAKFVLSWCQLGPDHYLADKDLVFLIKLLTTIQHPYIYPVTWAMSNETSGVVIRNFREAGTLRDIICKTKPRVPHLKKYGNPKAVGTVQGRDVQLFGRQILETLKFLHDKGFPYGHLHAGNVIVEDGRCRLLDIENGLLGLPSVYRAFFTQFKKIQTTEAVDVYAFGHLLYEMCYGLQLTTATCDNFPTNCAPEIRSVIESILTTEACKNGLPSVADLLQHPVFSNVVLPPSDKPVLKIPSKMKDSLREAKAAMERRLKDEQKVLGQVRRLSKAQAFHMSEDEKKKRRKSKKKQLSEKSPILENGDAGSQQSSGVSPASSTSALASSSTPTPPVPSDSPAPDNNSAPPPAAPPPPPPPNMPAPPPPPPVSTSAPSSGSGERSALLSSISGFSKAGLKKTDTTDKSGPRV